MTIYVQKWLWCGMFLSFAIKVPMWPFHTWLPDAHVEAPTIGSMILAGILLKVGGFAFLRISLPFCQKHQIFFSIYYFIVICSSHLHIYCSICTDRYKKTYSIFFSSSYGVCNSRNIYNIIKRYSRCLISNDKSWCYICRVIFKYWHSL